MWKRENFPEFLRTEGAFSNVRYVGDRRDEQEVRARSWCFFDVLVPCIAGKKIWTSQMKVAKTISESNCVTVVDEAFTVLCIENYWNKWVNGGVTLWTQSRTGNTGYMGWDKKAYTRFVVLCKHIKEERLSGISREIEVQFRDAAILANKGNIGMKKRRGGDDVPTFDELDD